jgi:hypothetical protein
LRYLLNLGHDLVHCKLKPNNHRSGPGTRQLPLCADIVEKVENRTTPKIPQKLIFGVPAAAKHRGADTKVFDRFCVKR